MSLDKSAIHFISTPYTKYARGLHGAYLDACRVSAKIHRRYGVVVFSPIAHCHGMTMHGDLPPIDHLFWESFNKPFVQMCGGLIVAMLEGWEESVGIAGEVRDFKMAGKPIKYADPVTLELSDGPQRA